MISRRRSAAWLGFLSLCLTSVLACQRVPLLAPTGSTITLTTTTTALPVNGTTKIVVQIIENAGTPPQRGTHVTFTTTLGIIEPAETETDINGQAAVTFKAGVASGTATITAISGGASVSSANALKILVGTAAVGKVIINASPSLVPALGGSSTISAIVLDVNGNPLVSAPVSFSTTAGTLSSTLASTDNAGAAQAVLTTNVQATVTASVGAQGGSTTTPPTTGGGTTTPTTPTSGQASGTVTVGVAGSPTLTIAPPATLSAGLPSLFTFTVAPAATNGSPIRQVTVNWGDRSATQDLGALAGTTSTTVAHVYTSPGTYPIVATVTDAFGSVVNVSITVVVNPRPQPTVTLTATTTNPTAGTDVTFTGSVAVSAGAPGTVIQNVSIDFGDGTKTELGAATGSAIALHHVYQTAGNYTVTLTATDSNGGVGTAVTTIFVQAATPLGVSLTFTRTNVDASNTLASFTATVTGLGNAVVTQYLWDFGDGEGQPTTTNQVTHNYTKPAPARTVRVTITTSDNRTTFGTTTITP